jgi:hypothetical protein
MSKDNAETIQWLPVKLTEGEIIEKARELAAGIKRFAVITEEAKDSAKDYREQKDSIKASNESLAEIVADGYEKRPVEVERIPDYDRGVTRVVRTDTGEQLSEVKMSDADRQASLPN